MVRETKEQVYNRVENQYPGVIGHIKSRLTPEQLEVMEREALKVGADPCTFEMFDVMGTVAGLKPKAIKAVWEQGAALNPTIAAVTSVLAKLQASGMIDLINMVECDD